MMRHKKLAAVLLSGIMTVAMGVTAFAQGGGDAGAGGTGSNLYEEGKITVEKTLNIAEGITVPTANFKFNVEAQDGAPSLITGDAATIQYNAEDTVVNNEVVKSADITFNAAKFPHAGKYDYTISEQKGTYTITDQTKETMTYDDESYTVSVYVVNGEKGLEIEKVLAKNSGNDKVEKLAFENTYTKKGNTDDTNTSLAINKVVTGDYADKTTDFTFNLMITLPSTATDADRRAEYTGKVGETTYTFKDGVNTEFKLKDGETLNIAGLPAGTRYTVTETGTAEFTATAAVTENGGSATSVNGEEGQALKVENKLVGEKANKVTFTNKYDDDSITQTGIIVNNLPFILMIAAAVAGIALYLASRRRFQR